MDNVQSGRPMSRTWKPCQQYGQYSKSADLNIRPAIIGNASASEWWEITSHLENIDQLIKKFYSWDYSNGITGSPPYGSYMCEVWSCLPKPFLRYYKKELFSCLIKVKGHGQGQRSRVEVTDHWHLHRYTHTKFEVVCPNRSWDIVRKSYFHVFYDPCDLEWPLTFTF